MHNWNGSVESLVDCHLEGEGRALSLPSSQKGKGRSLEAFCCYKDPSCEFHQRGHVGLPEIDCFNEFY